MTKFAVKLVFLVEIGNIQLPAFSVLLAPMEDITDPSFRMLCKEYGADMVYTEFVSSDGLIRDGKKSVQKLNIFETERPIGIQIYGNDVDAMVAAAQIAERSSPDLIDINFGCPVKKIARRGAGSGIMRNVPLMEEITSAVVNAVKLPVTVKTRLGWDENTKYIVDIAERLQDVGIKAITIHGRTRSQMFTGEADWSLIGEVKNNPRMKIPVIGNGDINSPEKAKEYFERYGVDAIMIGRATIGCPWIFRDIKEFIAKGTVSPQPDIDERVKLAIKHFNLSLQHKGYPRGMYEMRRHLIKYFKGLPHFKEHKMKLITESDPEMIIKELENLNKGNYRTDTA